MALSPIFTDTGTLGGVANPPPAAPTSGGQEIAPPNIPVFRPPLSPPSSGGTESGYVSPLAPSYQQPQGQAPTFPSGPVAGSSVATAPSQGGSILDLFPGYQNSLALENMGLGQLDANLNQQRQQAIINFGDPALAQLAGFGIDPQAGAFAQQNYLSGNATLARLDRAHQLAQQAVINRLAAHGILNSGELGYDQGQENTQYGNNVYDAQQSVLQQLAQLYSTYLGSRSGLENNVNDAQMAALQAFLSNPDAYSGLFGPQTQTQAPPKVTAPKTALPKSKPSDAIARYLGNR